MADASKVTAELAAQIETELNVPVVEHQPDAKPSRPVKLEVDDRGFGHLTVGEDDVSRLVNEVTIVARVGQDNRIVWGNGDVTGLHIEIGSPVLAMIADGERHLKLHKAERDALISLGWTPPAHAREKRDFWWGNTPYPFEATYVPDPAFLPRFGEFEVSREGGCPVHMVHAPCGWESEVDKMPEKFATINELIALAESHLRYGCEPSAEEPG